MGKRNRRSVEGNGIMKKAEGDRMFRQLREYFMRGSLLLTIAICFGAFTGKCAAVAAEISIVAFGDSTTARRGDLKIYTDILAKELPGGGVPVRVINAGIGGNERSSRTVINWVAQVISNSSLGSTSCT